MNYLREEDSNKARPDQIELDFQGHTTTRDEQDQAKNRFICISLVLKQLSVYLLNLKFFSGEKNF